MKLSEHSKKRMRERTSLNHQERKGLFRKALDYGKSPGVIDDEKLKVYLTKTAEKNDRKVKLYKGYVFIYSKNSKQLYTMYRLPKRFLKGDEVNGLIK